MKREFLKKVALGMCIFTMMATVTGCSSSSSTDTSGEATEEKKTTEVKEETEAEMETAATDSGEPKSIYIVAPDSGNAWTRLKQGVDDACAEYGWENTLMAPTTPYSAVEMAELCSTAVSAGADIIMIFTADTEFFKDVIEEAKAAGVYMISIAKPNEYCDLRVGTDDVEMGENFATALIQAMGDKPIKVIEMMSDVTSEGQMGQIAPFEEKLAELAPDAEIVSRIDCNYNTATAADNMSATYATYPDANCVISIDGDGAVGCASFVNDYDLEDEFVVIGVDDNASVLNCMLEGTITLSVINQWYEYGYQATQFAYQHLVEGTELEFNQGVDSLILSPEEVETYAAENNIDLNQ